MQTWSWCEEKKDGRASIVQWILSNHANDAGANLVVWYRRLVAMTCRVVTEPRERRDANIVVETG